MNDLVIKLTGEVLSSNFEQWKDALVAQIRSTRTELSLSLIHISEPTRPY